MNYSTSMIDATRRFMEASLPREEPSAVVVVLEEQIHHAPGKLEISQVIGIAIVAALVRLTVAIERAEQGNVR